MGCSRLSCSLESFCRARTAARIWWISANGALAFDDLEVLVLRKELSGALLFKADALNLDRELDLVEEFIVVLRLKLVSFKCVASERYSHHHLLGLHDGLPRRSIIMVP